MSVAIWAHVENSSTNKGNTDLLLMLFFSQATKDMMIAEIICFGVSYVVILPYEPLART